MRFPLILALVFLLALPPSVHAADDADTDGDGLPDLMEDANGNGTVDGGETNPYDADTDGGGESDGSEVKAGRSPLVKEDDLTYDADNDGWVNGVEIVRGTDPKKADTDGDGVKDGADPFPLNPDFDRDDDGNGLPDAWEERVNLQSVGTQSMAGDPDNDGLTNAQEFEEGTDPLLADTDRDGITDQQELAANQNPRENACLSFGGIAEPFPDVADHWSKEFVSRLQRTRSGSGSGPIIGGYTISGATVFLPDRNVTRFEFLKMVLLSTCIPLTAETIDVSVRFSDVSSIAQFEETADMKLRREIIYTAVLQNIVAGYPDGTFRPDDPINRAEALKILIGAARLIAPKEATNLARIFPDVPEKAWFRQAVSTSLWYEIVKGYDDGTFKPEQLITRAEAAKIIYLSMSVNPLVNGYIFPPLAQ